KGIAPFSGALAGIWLTYNPGTLQEMAARSHMASLRFAAQTPTPDRNPVQVDQLHRAWLEMHDTAFSAAAGEFRAARSTLLVLERDSPSTMVMREIPQPRQAFVLFRGQYDAPRDAVEPEVPEFIMAFPKSAPRNRLGLAQWLIDPRNPLTARVVVNRFWQSIFGTGLVKTSENFGYQGDVPSHPELLDWLAIDF